MGKRLVDKKHLMWVRTLPCFISRAGFLSCSGSVQAHHLLKGYDTPRGVNGRGMSLKNGDDQVIPLCQMHHHLLHTKYGSEKPYLKHMVSNKQPAQTSQNKLITNTSFY